MRGLATFSIERGAGRTATAVDSSHLAAADGRSTPARDLDPQGIGAGDAPGGPVP